MIRFIQALLSGLFFTLVYDFLLYIAIWIHYIKPQEIETFFNPFFWDNQNSIILVSSVVFLTLIIGYSSKIIQNTLLTLCLLIVFGADLYAPFGYYLGKILLEKQTQTLKDNRYTYHGNIIFNGRKSIYFYDTDVNQTFEIEKKNIQ